MNAWAETAAAVLVILAAALAVDRTWVQRSHWPVAVALCVAMLEPLRPDAGSAAKLLCIGLPALSAWLTVRVLARSDLLALSAAVFVFAAASLRLDDWTAAPSWALGTSVLVQAFAVLVVVPRRRLGLADRCVLVLFAGDVAALFGPAAEHATAPVQQWWLVQWQAAAVALALCLLHVAAELAERRRHG